MYYIKSSRVGKPKKFETTEQVLIEVKHILQRRQAGNMLGKIIIERRPNHERL